MSHKVLRIDIPVYRCSYEVYETECREADETHIAKLKTFGPLDDEMRDQFLAERRSTRQTWRFNQVMGWLHVFSYCTQLRAIPHVPFGKVYRNTLPKPVYAKPEFVICNIEKGSSSGEIHALIVRELKRQTLTGAIFAKRYLDLSLFDEFRDSLDWTQFFEC